MDRSAEAERSVAERALQMAAALSAEVAVLRERLEILEQVAAERGLFQAADIDGYQPDENFAARLKTKRQALIQRVFGALRS